MTIAESRNVCVCVCVRGCGQQVWCGQDTAGQGLLERSGELAGSRGEAAACAQHCPVSSSHSP